MFSIRVPGEWVPAHLACAIIPSMPTQPPLEIQHNPGWYPQPTEPDLTSSKKTTWDSAERNQQNTWCPSKRLYQKQTLRKPLQTEFANGNHTDPKLPWAFWSPSRKTPRRMPGSTSEVCSEGFKITHWQLNSRSYRWRVIGMARCTPCGHILQHFTNEQQMWAPSCKCWQMT